MPTPTPTPTDYRTTVRVDASADVVFDAITTTTGLTAWWSPVTGSGSDRGRAAVPHGGRPAPLLIHVDEATRPRTVRWTVAECTFLPDWVGTRPTFIITALNANHSELTFEHRGLDDELECKDMCSRSWDHFVGTSLRELVEGGRGRPQPQPARPRPTGGRGNPLTSVHRQEPSEGTHPAASSPTSSRLATRPVTGLKSRRARSHPSLLEHAAAPSACGPHQ